VVNLEAAGGHQAALRPARTSARRAFAAQMSAAKRCLHGSLRRRQSGSRTYPRRPATPGSYGRAQSTRGPRDPLRAWAGSLFPGCARAQGPDARDALHLPRSQDTSCGPGPGVLEHRWGTFTFGAPTCGARHGGEKAPAQRERKGSERRKDFAKQNPEGGQAKPGRAFGASLARRTAGATLLPLCALPYR
jgi:hypothetical protein